MRRFSPGRIILSGPAIAVGLAVVYLVCCYPSGGQTPPATGPSGAGPSDTESSDTGPSDTGPSDTESSDTGPSDTGPSDTGPSGIESSSSTEEVAPHFTASDVTAPSNVPTLAPPQPVSEPTLAPAIGQPAPGETVYLEIQTEHGILEVALEDN